MARRYESIRKRPRSTLHLPGVARHVATARAAAGPLAVQFSHPGPGMGFLVLLLPRAMGRRSWATDHCYPDRDTQVAVVSAGTFVWRTPAPGLLGKPLTRPCPARPVG